MPSKVYVLYSEMAPYMVACLDALRCQTGCEVRGLLFPKDENAPLDLTGLEEIGDWESRSGLSDDDIRKRIADFDPDVVLSAGWMDKGYCRVLAGLSGRCLRVGLCDSQLDGSLRQWIAQRGRRFLHQRCFDVLWVTGERQAAYGRALGFHGSRLWSGAYACEWERFAGRRDQKPEARGQRQDHPTFKIQHSTSNIAALPHFLYVGRLIEQKGIDVLRDAYANYRERVEAPWELHCVGQGPQREMLDGRPGVILAGFVQPEALPAIMAGASAFVLPSRVENWGVVLQEAACLGLPLIATEACGAGVHLLRDGWNGYLVETGSVEALAGAMLNMHQAGVQRRADMGEASYLLSRQFTPALWAGTLEAGYRKWREGAEGARVQNMKGS